MVYQVVSTLLGTPLLPPGADPTEIQNHHREDLSSTLKCLCPGFTVLSDRKSKNYSWLYFQEEFSKKEECCHQMALGQMSTLTYFYRNHFISQWQGVHIKGKSNIQSLAPISNYHY